MATLDEASRCPICSQPGRQTASSSGSKGSKLYNYLCMNTECRWFDTGWLVQLDRNGDVYERPKGQKEFAPIPEAQQRLIEAQLEQLKNA